MTWELVAVVFGAAIVGGFVAGHVIASRLANALLGISRPQRISGDVTRLLEEISRQMEDIRHDLSEKPDLGSKYGKLHDIAVTLRSMDQGLMRIEQRGGLR